MQNFTPWASLIGGVFIGLAGAVYLLAAGRIAGISGMIEDLFKPRTAAFRMAAMFLVGLPLGALLTRLVAPQAVPAASLSSGSLGLLLAAGLLVGFGARIGGGCTSGHGVCGLPRFSVRSWIATGTFMLTAALTVFVVRHVL